MARRNINIDHALNYVCNLANDRLDGLYFTLKDKMAELKIKQDKPAADAYKFTPSESGATGSLRGIMDWAECIAPPVKREMPKKLPEDRKEVALIQKQVDNENARKQEAFKEDCVHLVLLHSVIRKKFVSVGYDPQRVTTESEVLAAKAAEDKGQQEANEKARQTWIDEQKKKIGTPS